MPPRSRPRDPFVASIRLVLDVARRRRFRAALIGGFALPFYGVQRATGDVDFLVAVEGADALDDALLAAGARRLYRSADAANYDAGSSGLAPVDFIYADRPRARDMLQRARGRLLRQGGVRVPVVDVESLIGLKLQAVVNHPSRVQDAADIRALVAAAGSGLNVERLRDYYRVFDREPELEHLLADVAKR